MKTTLIISILILALFSINAIASDNIKEEKFKVSGNCGECKTRIEEAMKIKEVKFAKWDKKSKMLTVAFDSKTMTADSLQKLAASVGHDTEKYKASDEVYNNLPSCCLYRTGKAH
jgi:periplasmic mercuric ion binding protein